MTALVRAEWTKLFSTRVWIGLLLGACLLVTGFVVLFTSFAGSTPGGGQGGPPGGLPAVGTEQFEQLVLAVGANVTDDAHVINYLNQLNWDRPEVVLDKRTPQAMLDEAVRVASQADVIVAAVGEARGMSHESSSRTRLDLPDSQQALLRALKATGKPLSFEGVSFIRIKDGKIAYQGDYYDALGFNKQLGW